MKHFLILLFSLPLFCFAQGKFFGGNGSGYSSTNLTIQTGAVLGIPNKEPMLFPNPSSSILHFNTSIPESTDLFDTAGRAILWVKVGTKHLDVSTLQPGLYFIRIADVVYKLQKE